MEKIYYFFFCNLKNLILKYHNYIIIKIIIYLLLLYYILNCSLFKNNVNVKNLKSYKYYINDCKKHKRYLRKKIYNKSPYISVCLPALNMDKYLEQTILSIINQSFQDFEITIVDDNSKDNTQNILKKMYLEDSRIKIIYHSINKGVYFSRVESILNSNGKYIILMDPDDMYLNKNLFLELFNYNLEKNIDIIEFTVYHQIEGRRNLINPNNHFEAHYHNFSKNIIYQPELSKILFHVPNTQYYTKTICRNIWNKMIRRNIFLNMHEFIGLEYFNNFVITSDDMLMNLICYHYAYNYSNINLPGYMYNLREVSMSHGEGGIALKKIRSINHLLYFKIFYRFLKTFNFGRLSLYYEIRNLKRFIYFIKDYTITSYEKETKEFLNEIINDINSNFRFKLFLSDLLLYFEEKNQNILFPLSGIKLL